MELKLTWRPTPYSNRPTIHQLFSMNQRKLKKFLSSLVSSRKSTMKLSEVVTTNKQSLTSYRKKSRLWLCRKRRQKDPYS